MATKRHKNHKEKKTRRDERIGLLSGTLISEAFMRMIEVGLRMNPQTGHLTPFGTDEVNDLIRRGARVVSVDQGGAMMQKIGDQPGGVRMVVSGFCLKVRVDDSMIL